MQLKNGIARFRTIRQCLETIKNLDPDTAITEWYIRQLCKNGKIICNGSGNKFLISLDSLLEFLNRGYDENTQKENLEDREDEQQ